MPCLADRSNYFLITTTPIAVAACLSVAITKSTWFLRLLVGVVAAQILYAVLAFNFPDTFEVKLTTDNYAIWILAAFTVFILLAAAMIRDIFVVCMALTTLSPIFYHNLAMLDAQARTISPKLPPWIVLASFTVALVALCVLIYMSKVVVLAGYAIRILGASLALFVAVRLAMIEYGTYDNDWVGFVPPPDAQPLPFFNTTFARLGMCCELKGGDRCPIAFNDYRYDCIFVVVLILMTYATYRIHTASCCSRRAKEAKDGKGVPKKVDTTST